MQSILGLTIMLSMLTLQTASEQCHDEFPFYESKAKLLSLFERFGSIIDSKDDDGNLWFNRLITVGDQIVDEETNSIYTFHTRAENVQIGFKFDNSLVIDDIPTFLVSKDVEDKKGKPWEAHEPDWESEIVAVTVDCPEDKVASGLACFPKEYEQVQNKFLDASNKVDGILFGNEEVNIDGIKYTLKQSSVRAKRDSSTQICSYKLSQWDPMFNALTTFKNVTTIYYSCPSDSTCCCLTCIGGAKSMSLVEKIESRFENMKSLLPSFAICIVFAFIFASITYYVCCKYRFFRKDEKVVQAARRCNQTKSTDISCQTECNPLYTPTSECGGTVFRAFSDSSEYSNATQLTSISAATTMSQDDCGYETMGKPIGKKPANLLIDIPHNNEIEFTPLIHEVTSLRLSK